MATKHRPPAKTGGKKVVGTVNILKPPYSPSKKASKKASKKGSSKKAY
jgi:hypothetical protein